MIKLFYKRINQLRILRVCFDLPFSKHTLLFRDIILKEKNKYRELYTPS